MQRMKKSFPERNPKENNPIESEEKYQFMREEIRPQKKRLVTHYVHQLMGTMALAVIFGLVAAAAFVMVQKKMNSSGMVHARETIQQTTGDVAATAHPLEKKESGDMEKVGYYSLWQEIGMVGNYCNQSVVGVQAAHNNSWFYKEKEAEAVHSGLIFRESADQYYILTDSGNVTETKRLEIEFTNGEVVGAEISGIDHVLGLAVLQVAKKDVSKQTREDIRVAALGDTSTITLGSPVIAFGKPNGVMRSVMSGNIVNCSLHGEIADGIAELYCSDIDFCEEANGFVADMEGDLIGVITNAFTDVTGSAGCAFLSISTVRPRILHLVNNGAIAYLGITGCKCCEEGKIVTASKEENGVYVTSVILRSPAYQGKIRVADIITELDGCKINDLEELQQSLLSYEPNEKVVVTVVRNTGTGMNEKKLKVILK